MVMRILPQVQQDPQRSPAGQVDGRVAPMRDATASQIADIGEGMVNLGQNVTRAADIFQDNLDIAKSAEAENRLRDVIREQMEAPETGYFNTVGMDAAGDRRKRAFDAVKAAQQDIDRSLDNNAQKNNFRDQASSMLSRVTAIADRHQQREVVNARIGQMKARSLNSLEEAAKLVGTDAGEIAKGSGLRDIDDYGAASGMSPDEIRFEKLKWTTALHETVVRGIVRSGASGAGSVAASYLEQHAAEVSSARIDDLHQLTRAATSTDWAASASEAAQRQATEEFSKSFMAREGVAAPTAVDIEATWQRASEIIRRDETLPVEVRDKALGRLEADYKQVKTNEARTSNAVLDEATKWLLANPLESPNSLPPELEQQVDAAGVRGELNAWAGSGKRYASSPMVEAGLATISDERLRKTPPDVLFREFRGRLDDAAMNELMSRQRKALGTASKNDEVAITRADRIKESFYEIAGKKRNETLNDADAKAFVDFRKKVQDRINYEPQDRELDAKRLQEILDEVAIDKVSVDAFIDYQSPSYLVTDEQRADAYVTVRGNVEPLRQIRPEIRQEIISELVRAGERVTEESIMREWIDGGRQR